MKKIKENLVTACWSLKLAFQFDAKILLTWSSISIILAILPAIMLYYNREAVSILSNYLLTGTGTFSDVVKPIVALGIILTAIGISNRFNRDFLYFIMYDSYYFGMEEHLMDMVNRIELKTLMDKKYRDDHKAIMGYCGALAEFISSGCIFLSKAIGMISLLVVAATTSFTIFFATLVYTILMLIFNVIVSDHLRWNQEEYSDKSRLANYYKDSVMSSGIAKEMRIYGLATETENKFSKAYGQLETYHDKYDKGRHISITASHIGFYLFIIAVIAFSIHQVSIGLMTIDIFVMVYALIDNIQNGINDLNYTFQNAYDGLYYLGVQRKFVSQIPMDEEDWEQGFDPLDANIVFKAENLYFSYDDETDVLHDLSFEIKKGETIALVGLNGSGKTTLVKLLINLFSATKGKLYFYGKPYDMKTRGAVIQRIGMFFQDFYIFHATLRENVGFGDLKHLNHEDRILEALNKGDAGHFHTKYPLGLEQWLQRDVKKDGAILSGGEKQRLAVSRAHMSDKEILIFDEPAAALDPIAEMNQFHTIRGKIKGRTAILISHRVGFARLADRIIVLDKGRIVETGTHEELINTKGLYANFFYEQAHWYQKEEGEIE